MRVAFFTLGCKVNQYETQILSQLFADDGYDVVSHTEPADVYILNSCTVTSTGDKKTRQMLRRFKSQNPGAVVALTGCFPQAFPDAAERLPEADVITGSSNRARLPEAVKRCLATGERVIDISPHQQGEGFEHMSLKKLSERTRAFVKIEDGCERYCSYCIIPKARGPVRSKPLTDLREELHNLARASYQEVVLVGVNLSCYGAELGIRLIDAVELACSIDGIQRVRLGSLEPELLSEEDIQRMAAQPKVCPQFHLSLQSGCDETLKRMNRHYTTREYESIVRSLRKNFKNCAITTDIMVGFPKETEEEFQQSMAFASKIAFPKVHVFAYSPREGTRAAAMPGQISKGEKEERSARMIALTQEVRKNFLQSQVGQTVSVLFERELAPHVFEGYSENYTPVHLSSPEDLHGKILPVKIISAQSDWCTGQLM